MKKKHFHWTWYLSILLVVALVIGPRAIGSQAGGETPASPQPAPDQAEDMSEMFAGTVVEVIDAGRQFYVQIDTGAQRVWVAVPAFGGKVGDAVIVPPGLPVADFHSKKLNRRFEMIYFVGGIRTVNNP